MDKNIAEKKNIVDLAFSYDQMLKDGDYKSIKEMSSVIGKSSSTISRIRTIVKLPDTVLKHIQTEEGIKDSVVLSKLSSIRDKEAIERLYFDFIKRGYSRDDMLRTIDWSKKHSYKVQRQYAKNKNLFMRRRGRVSIFKVTNIGKDDYEKIKSFIRKIIEEE